MQSQQSQPQQQQQNGLQEQFVEKYISDMKNAIKLFEGEDNTFMQTANTMAVMIRAAYAQKNGMSQADKTQFKQMRDMASKQIDDYRTNRIQSKNGLKQDYQTMLDKVGPNCRIGQEITITIKEIDNQNDRMNQFCQGMVNEYKNMVV